MENEVTQPCAERSLAERYEAMFRVAHPVDFMALFLYDEGIHTFENPVLETVNGQGIVVSRFPSRRQHHLVIYHNRQPM
jgi:hypothetical protein